jgi:precorrin-2 methylase
MAPVHPDAPRFHGVADEAIPQPLPAEARMSDKRTATRRDQVINMRAKRRDVDLIDAAAKQRGLTRSAFIVQHALAEARAVIREAERDQQR